MSRKTCIMGTVNGRGYDGQLKYTICNSRRPCHSILSILNPVFFAKFDIFVVLTTRSGAYISRFSDFCVHDNNDHFTPAHARVVIILQISFMNVAYDYSCHTITINTEPDHFQNYQSSATHSNFGRNQN